MEDIEMERFEVDNDDVDDEVCRQAETSLDLPNLFQVRKLSKKFAQTKSVMIL